MSDVAALRPEQRKAAKRIIFITLFLDLLGFGLIIPQLPFYAKACGIGGKEVGLLAGVYSLVQFLMAPYWGRVSDRAGRRPVILVGLAGAGVSYLIFGAAFRIAGFTGVSPVIVLAVSRMMAGFFNSNIACAQAYMADVSAPEERTAAMGLVGAAIGLGFVMGPAISGGVWVATKSAELPFYLAAACELACFQWAWRALPETRTVAAREAAPRRRLALDLVPPGAMRTVLLTAMLAATAFAGLESTLGLYVVDEPSLHFDNLQFAMVLLYLSLVMVFTQGAGVKPITRRIGETRMLGLGTSFLVAGMGWLAFVQGPVQLYGGVTLAAFGYGLISPSLSGLNARLAPDAVRGEVLGVGQSMTALGRIVGPVVGGVLYEKVSRGSTYALGAALAVLCTLLAVRLDKQILAGAKE